jgi:protein O-mannosyl-transferase
MSGRKRNIPTIQPGNKRPNPAQNNSSVTIPAWMPLAVLTFTGILYIKSLFGELTTVDDDFYILKNPFLRDFSLHGVKAIFTSFYQTNYHPLTTLTFFLEYNWFGLNPIPYHLLNVVLHLANTWLVFRLAEQLSGKRLTALVVCILFAVHPLHVESVAWISERKDVLYAFFYLSSLLYYLRYLRSGYKAQYYLLALLLFLASLFSKSAAVTLPVVMVIADWYTGRKITSRSIMEKIPFLLLSILFGVLAILSQHAGGAINNYASAYSFVTKFFIFTSALCFYCIKLVLPAGLSILHYSPYILGNTLRWYYYLSLPFLLLLTWLVVRRSPLRKEMIFGVCFFIAAISVMLQIIPVGSAYVAERYTYVAYIGFFYIIGQWMSGITAGKWRNISIGAFAAITLFFSCLTWNRIDVWKDDTTLFNDLVDSNPEIYSAYLYRGDLRRSEGDLPGALDDYTKSIALNPEFAETYSKRSNIYDAIGNIRAARADYDILIRLKPDYAIAYNNRGWDNFQLGNIQAAFADYDKAIAIDPNYAQAFNNRGWAYYKSGNMQAAIADYSKAISLSPRFDKPYYNRAAIRFEVGDFGAAIEDYNSILKLHPDDGRIYYQRAQARLDLKDHTGACADWQKALETGNKAAREMIEKYCR